MPEKCIVKLMSGRSSVQMAISCVPTRTRTRVSLVYFESTYALKLCLIR